jgi:hypothetical protein
MNKLRLKKINISIVVSVFCFSFFNSCNAAVLYLEPASGEYYKGDVFIVDARIDVEKECINTVEANLSFPQDILEVVDFSEGDSILSFWLKRPVAEQGKGLISFSGGIPAGYCGEIPGDPGRSNLLTRIIFRVKEDRAGSVELKFLDNSQVLLNDGFGTLTKLAVKSADFAINSGSSSAVKTEWQQEINKDAYPPEQFGIQIDRDASIFNNQYFIVFFTTDKQTGIAYYEIKEGEKDWKKGESPYLLEDQKLKSIIKVRAVDKAGNEAIAEYSPEITEKPFPRNIIFLIIILLILGVCYWLYKKKRKK